MRRGVHFALAIALSALIAQAQQNNWRLGNGTQGLRVHDVEPCLNHPDSAYALADSAGPKLLWSTDRGQSWRMMLRERGASIITGSIKPDVSDSKVVYLSYSWLNLRGSVNTSAEMTTDGGSTWVPLGINENPVGTPSVAERNPLAPQAVYVGVGYSYVQNSGQVILTRDQARHWDTLFVAGGGPEAMTIASSDTNIIYQGFSGYVYRSTDGGHSWGTAVAVRPWISGLAVDPQDASRVYYTHHATGGVLRSTDGGTSWLAVNEGLIDTVSRDVTAIAINPRNPNELFITGRPISCYRSTNGGDNWSRFDFGLPPDVGALSITIDTLGNRIYLGTDAGIYVNNLVTYLPPPTDQHPQRFGLGQNYPNPFNPLTNFSFDVPHTEWTTLVLYDVLGRKLKTLLDETKLPGRYWMTVDASSLSSGVYFYRMQAGQFYSTRKMVVLH